MLLTFLSPGSWSNEFGVVECERWSGDVSGSRCA